MGDFSNYGGYAVQKTGAAPYGHVPYYNSLNLWMNKPSMTSSSPSSVIMTSSYIPRQAMSDVGTFGGLHRVGGDYGLVLPQEHDSRSVVGHQRGVYTTTQVVNGSPAFFAAQVNKDKSQNHDRYNRWQPKGPEPSASRVQFVPFPTKPTAFFQAQRPQAATSPNPQDIYRYHNNVRVTQADDTMTSSKEKSQMTPMSTYVIQKSNDAKDIPTRNANVYVSEPQRTVKSIQGDGGLGVTSPHPLVSQSFAPNGLKTPTSEIGNFLPSGHIADRLKKGEIQTSGVGSRTPFRSGGQVEDGVFDEIDELYGKINPSTKTKVHDPVNSNSRPTRLESKDQGPINWSPSPISTQIQNQFSSISPSSMSQISSKGEDPASFKSDLPRSSEVSSPPRSQLPRTDVGSRPLSSTQLQRISEESPRPLRSQLPRTDISQAPSSPSRSPLTSNDAGPVRSELPRSNVRRNQPTVGHRMLRDVLKGRRQFDQSTATTSAIDEGNVVHNAFRFLDDFED